MSFFRRERVLDGHGLWPVRRSQRESASLEQPVAAPHQRLADAAQGQLSRRVGYSAGAVRPQLVRERVVTAQPGDLFDQIDFTGHVGSPAGNLDGHPVVLRRGDETDRRQEALDFLPRNRDAEQVAYARLAQEHRVRLLGLWPEIDWRSAQLAPRHGADQVDRARQCVGHSEDVDTALEPIARFTRNTEGPTRAPNARRLEIGGFEN